MHCSSCQREHDGPHKTCERCLSHIRNYKNRLNSEGVCVDCGASRSETSTKFCVECLIKARARVRKVVNRRTEAGTCTLCAKAKPPHNRKYCTDCSIANQLRHRARATELHTNGLCVQCGKTPPEPSRLKCIKCKEVKETARKFKRYGVTAVEIQKRLSVQENKCAICSREKTLVIDHDHKSGKFRDLLCDDCNRGLGYIRESPTTARAIADYIEWHIEYQGIKSFSERIK